MGDFIQIRSVKQYFNDFIVEGLKHNEHPTTSDIVMIKQQILDTFRKEIFEQIADKIGPEAKDMDKNDLATLEPVNNILKNSFRKWRRLCILCTEYGLGQIFNLEDLRKVLDDEVEDDPQEIVYGEDKGEDVTDKMDEVLPEGEEPVYLEHEEPKVEVDGYSAVVCSKDGAVFDGGEVITVNGGVEILDEETRELKEPEEDRD